MIKNISETSDSKQLLIDFVTLLSGMVLILLKGYIPVAIFQDLLQAIGTAFFSAGFVGIILRRIKQEKEENTLKVATYNRITLSDEYKERKYRAEKVEIVSIALSGALEEISSDSNSKFLNKILFGNVNARLIFLSPLSDYVKQRAIEDNVSKDELRTILEQSVKEVKQIHKKLLSLYEEAYAERKLLPGKVGSLEIRIIDHCPHFTLYRTDEDILWGIYTSETRGTNSAVLNVNKENQRLFNQLTGHFDTLWHSTIAGVEKEGNYLLRFYYPSKPKHNTQLEELLLQNSVENDD